MFSWCISNPSPCIPTCVTSNMPTPIFLLLLPLTAALTPTPCVQDITWTVTGVQLSDYTTINPLSVQWEQRRTLDFHVSSPALPSPQTCQVDTLYYPVDEATRQFDEWTYMCWKGDAVPISNPGEPDTALAFRFSSAFADFDGEHPASFALRQGLECESG